MVKATYTTRGAEKSIHNIFTSLPLPAFPDPPQKLSKSKWPKPLDGAIQPQTTPTEHRPKL